ncbi:MAG: class I SAM-dependent methyltransferase [Calothrix sp. SM1_7_51]|nr:class I SAM-dependent methyltransferase [Calothrix sp. SM1_7_51]
MAINPIIRFDDKAASYTKYRPTYPILAINKILEGLVPEKILAVDIGAGTGISTRLLAERDVKTIAIEPNAKMRDAAEAHFLIEFQDGTSENTTLPSNSVDLITSFQAFHWFEPKSSLQEFHRILKPCGRLALVWNNLDVNDEFSMSYKRIVRSVSDNSTPENFNDSAKVLQGSDLFTNFSVEDFLHKRQMDFEILIGLVKSISWFPQDVTVQRKIFLQLEKLFQNFCDEDGFVYLAYCTSVNLAEKK